MRSILKVRSYVRFWMTISKFLHFPREQASALSDEKAFAHHSSREKRGEKATGHKKTTCRKSTSCFCFGFIYLLDYLRILEITPEPTVLPPSRIAKRSPSSIATGLITTTFMLMLSPGITISTPSGSSIVPVTSVVLMKN